MQKGINSLFFISVLGSLCSLSLSLSVSAQIQSGERLVSLPVNAPYVIKNIDRHFNERQHWNKNYGLRGDMDSTKKKANLKMLFTFDSHNSFLLNQKVKMFGLRLGLEMYDHYRFGFGWYFQTTPVEIPSVIRPADTLMQSLKFNYSTIFFEYVIYEDFKWEAVASFPLGRGTGIIDTISSLNGISGPMTVKDVGVFAPSIGGHYKLFYWLGIGSGVGYRFVGAPEKQVRKSLSSPFYVIKVKLFLGGLYKAVFKRKQIMEERAAWVKEREERKERRLERRSNRKNQ